MKKKVCHISTVHTEKDGRIVLKECNTLHQAGFEVVYIVTADEDKVIDGIKIRALKNCNGRIARFISKQRQALMKAIEEDADIYHFHDPELIFLGRKLKKRGKKVIYDVHEDIAKQILTKTYLGSLFTRKVISKIFNFVEKKISKSFDAIVTIQESIKDNYNGFNNNIVLVKNYARKELVNNAVSINKRKDILTLLYIGGLTEIRGIKEIINVTEYFNGKVRLWIMGPWETEELKKECEKLPGYKNCEYLGIKYGEEIYSYVKASDIGLSILHPTPNYKESTPTKVFEYMACELPVILSNFEFWKDAFGEVGIFVDPLNQNEFIEAIQYYIDNPDERMTQGQRNRERYINAFTWEGEGERLIKLYKDILR